MGKLKENGYKLMEKRIKEYKGQHISDGLLWWTIGVNNWRKMHGFPLMRGKTEKEGRIIHKKAEREIKRWK